MGMFCTGSTARQQPFLRLTRSLRRVNCSTASALCTSVIPMQPLLRRSRPPMPKHSVSTPRRGRGVAAVLTSSSRLSAEVPRVEGEESSHSGGGVEPPVEGAIGRRLALQRAAAAGIGPALLIIPGAAWSQGAADRAAPPRVLVTGASSGIGQASAELLVARGCEVILGCRTADAAWTEQARLASAVAGPAAIAVDMPLELTDLAGVSAFSVAVRDWVAEGGRSGGLSGLLLCAGVDGIPVERTPRGLEQHACINHLAGFLLAAELRPALAASGGGTVITLTSSAALDVVPEALADVNWERRPFDRRQAYCASKACCTLMADELAWRGRPSGVAACSVDPGPSATQIVRYTQPQRARQRQGMTPEQLARQAQQLGMRTPQQGAALAAAMAMRGPGPQGEAFVNGGMYLGAAAPTGTPVPLWSSPEWRTESVSASVWEQSQQLVAKWASREADFS
eukprot:jgi/Tetstr1/441215/TSEL_029471.t1